MPYYPDGQDSQEWRPRAHAVPPPGPGLQAQRLIIEFSPAVERALERIADALEGLNLSGVIMSQEMDELAAQIERNTTVVGSATDAFSGILAKYAAVTAELATSGVDTAKLASLNAQLAASTDKLAAAVVAGTPAASAPVAPDPVSTADVSAAPTAPALDAAPVVDAAPADPSTPAA